MNAYRMSGTVAPDRTITVQVPEASVGSEAEIIVLFPAIDSAQTPPLHGAVGEFFRWLEDQPRSKSTADEEQAFLRQLRDEWE